MYAIYHKYWPTFTWIIYAIPIPSMGKWYIFTYMDGWYLWLIMWVNMGVSRNRGIPKWMVKIMENPINPWMIWGDFPHYFRKHPYTIFPWIRNGRYRCGGWSLKPKELPLQGRTGSLNVWGSQAIPKTSMVLFFSMTWYMVLLMKMVNLHHQLDSNG